MRRFIALLGMFAVLGGLLIGDGLIVRTAAQDKPKVVVQKKPLVNLLDEMIETMNLQFPGGISLRDTLSCFSAMMAARGQELPIYIDIEAFKGGADTTDVYETLVKFPRFLKRMTLEEALSLAIGMIPSSPGGKATFLLRSDRIFITTTEGAAPGLQTVRAKFVKASLPEALEELSRQTGIGIVLDPRCVESRSVVTTTFPPETNLVAATGLLADMAGLQVRVVDRILYVTSRTNQDPLPAGSVPKKPEPAM